MYQKNSADYLENLIEMVDLSSEYLETAKVKEKEYELSEDSTIIESKNVVPLMLFIKTENEAG